MPVNTPILVSIFQPGMDAVGQRLQMVGIDAELVSASMMDVVAGGNGALVERVEHAMGVELHAVAETHPAIAIVGEARPEDAVAHGLRTTKGSRVSG
jgi:hypothetical protein